MKTIYYSISTLPQRKGIYIFRSSGVHCDVVAKFSSNKMAFKFAEELSYPLSDELIGMKKENK